MKPQLLIALLSFIAFQAQAAIHNVTSMTFAGGTFQQPGYTPEPIPMAGSDHNLIGGYRAFGAQFDFTGFPAMYFTGDGSMAPYGGMPVPGGPAPSATVDTLAGTITVDMSSWTVYWNGNNINQGAANVTGSWDPLTGIYHIAWSHTFNEIFYPTTQHYTMTGIAAVPEPEVHAFMLAGLGVVGMAVWRRRNNDHRNASDMNASR